MELQLLSSMRHLNLSILAALALTLVACEKEITVDLPETEPRVVVEGVIETGAPPVVILTRTQAYFAPTSLASIAASFISEATVTVFDGSTTHVLDRVCSSAIPEELLEEAAAATGIDVNLLANANICIWTKLDMSLLGEAGRSYRLEVQADNKNLRATTTIPNAVPLDSLWFRLAQQQPGDDSLGFIWARLSDPDTIGNHYRWLAQRTNAGPDGVAKDANFVAPFFSVFEDRYTNGLTFDFNFNRGARPFSNAEDDENEERGYFKRGDTVIVKLVSLDRASFKFYESFQSNVASAGDVFSNPANVISNVEGGLGVWSGWGSSLRTVICQP
ncbi:MAG: DUF4249 domain-containing protein [Flavobacteriales bacterium]|nr:DUF4249 domain-containing protein [Flavobacteriales bacterium]